VCDDGAGTHIDSTHVCRCVDVSYVICLSASPSVGRQRDERVRTSEKESHPFFHPSMRAHTPITHNLNQPRRIHTANPHTHTHTHTCAPPHSLTLISQWRLGVGATHAVPSAGRASGPQLPSAALTHTIGQAGQGEHMAQELDTQTHTAQRSTRQQG